MKNLLIRNLHEERQSFLACSSTENVRRKKNYGEPVYKYISNHMDWHEHSIIVVLKFNIFVHFANSSSQVNFAG